MDSKSSIRGAAYVILAGALIATAIALNNPLPFASRGDPSRESGALGSELARCRALDAEAANDAACRAAWQANRERFLGSRKLYRDRVTDSGPALTDRLPTLPPGGEQPGRGLQKPPMDSAPLAPGNAAGRAP